MSALPPPGRARFHLLPRVLSTTVGRHKLKRPKSAAGQGPVPLAAAGSVDEFGNHTLEFPNSADLLCGLTVGAADSGSTMYSAGTGRFRRFHFPEKKSFPCGFYARKSFGFQQKPERVAGRLKTPESSRGPQPFRTFNRAQRRVRWARGDFCAGKSHFPEKKSFPCSLRARKIFDF